MRIWIFWNLQLFPSGFKISTSTRIHIQIEFARPHVFCVFTHVASIYANLLEQKEAFT